MPVADGDLVIRKSETGSFTLETYPERPQISTRTYRAALCLARGFAKMANVLIWSVDSTGRFTEVKASVPSRDPAQQGGDDEAGS